MENKDDIFDMLIKAANATPESRAAWDRVGKQFRLMEEEFIKKANADEDQKVYDNIMKGIPIDGESKSDK